MNARLPAYLKTHQATIRRYSDKPIRWDSTYDKYQATFPLVAELYRRFPDKTIARADIVQILQSEAYALGSIAVLAWGGISGKSFAQVLTLTDADWQTRLVHAERLIALGEIKPVFTFFEHAAKLPGVGHAYFTKILSFLGQANPNSPYKPLIFDRWTKTAFYVFLHQSGRADLAHEFFKGLSHEGADVRTGKILADAYTGFVLDMNAWAAALSVEPVQLEGFVFGDHRGQNKSASNPRIELLALAKTFAGK